MNKLCSVFHHYIHLCSWFEHIKCLLHNFFWKYSNFHAKLFQIIWRALQCFRSIKLVCMQSGLWKSAQDPILCFKFDKDSNQAVPGDLVDPSFSF